MRCLASGRWPTEASTSDHMIMILSPRFCLLLLGVCDVIMPTTVMAPCILLEPAIDKAKKVYRMKKADFKLAKMEF